MATRLRWSLAALLLTLVSSVGCSPWPVTRPYKGGGSSTTPRAGDSSSGPDALGAPPLLLPQDGAANGDGTVTAIVYDGSGNTIGHVDFFSSDGAPLTDSTGNVFFPDAFIAVSGLENPFDASSVEGSGGIDIPANAMTPGASFDGRAGGLDFVATVEQADVENIDGTDAFEASSLVVRIDVSSNVSSADVNAAGDACVPDAQQSCTCPDGTQSVAQCQNDGQWGSCACSGW